MRARFKALAPLRKIRLEKLGALAGDRRGVAEATRKLLDAAGRVDELLLAREERMARGANTDLQVFAGGAGVIDLATGAADGGLGLIGMDIFFHGDCFGVDFATAGRVQHHPGRCPMQARHTKILTPPASAASPSHAQVAGSGTV